MVFLGTTAFGQAPSPVFLGTTAFAQAPFAQAPFAGGDVFAAVSNGQVQHYDGSGNLLETLNTGLGGFTTGMADDGNNLYVTNFSVASVSQFTGKGIPHVHSVFFTTDPLSAVESILFDANGDI